MDTSEPFGVLTREQLLEGKPRCDTVDVPRLGGKVFIRGLKAKETIGMSDRYGDDKGDVPMLLSGVITEDGKPVFTDADLPALLESDYAVVAPILIAIKRLTGLLPDIPKASAESS